MYERENARQIDRLNQRGGRPLSVVDLILANTLDLDTASYLCAAVAHGASVVSGAVPGGAGKTTVLAAVLAFVPPRTRIITVDAPERLAHAAAEALGESLLLVHEIGGGPYYGYLWGRDVRDLFALQARAAAIAATIHEDTIEGLSGTLLGPALGVAPEDFRGLDLAVFVTIDFPGGRARRRVSSVYERTDADHVRVREWDEASDSFRQCGAPGLLARLAEERSIPTDRMEASHARVRRLLGELAVERIVDFHEVCEHVRERIFGRSGVG